MGFSLKKFLIKNVNLYPPYLGAGIYVESVNHEMTRFVVGMKLRWYNRNLFGTHFGGSLYAMCDPFYVFILLNYLGNDYIVWDKGAKIKFRKPGKTHVKATFFIPETRLYEIKQEVEIEGKKVYHFQTTIEDIKGEIIAEIEKEVYVKKKNISIENIA